MLEKRTSAERLEESGRRVVDWLNSPRASRHPVTKLFVLAQTMIHAYEHSRFPFDRGDFEGYQAEINRIAGNYPGVCALAGLNGPRPESAYFRLESLKKSRDAIDGWGALNDVRVLAEGGALWRIRRCALPSCKRAFYAKFPHHLFHDAKCKQKSKESSPEFKAHRRQYMRRRYHSLHHGLSSTRKTTPRARRKKTKIAANLDPFEEFLKGEDHAEHLS